jgi:hypothetical protein
MLSILQSWAAALHYPNILYSAVFALSPTPGGRYPDGRMDGDRSPHDTRLVTVPEAAEILGISPEAVRARLNRGTLFREKGLDGTTYVRLNADRTRTNDERSNDRMEHISPVAFELLKDQVAFLRAELERKDAIIMSLTQRIPELEPAASPEPRESPTEASETVDKGEGHNVPPEGERRSWWQRWFGGSSG